MFILVETVLERRWFNCTEAETCSAVELYGVILRGISDMFNIKETKYYKHKTVSTKTEHCDLNEGRTFCRTVSVYSVPNKVETECIL